MKAEGRPSKLTRAEIYRNEIKEKLQGANTLGNFEYNSVYSEICSFFTKNGLLFASDRDTGKLSKIQTYVEFQKLFRCI